MPRSGDYAEVLAAMDAIGADATSLTLFWDDLVKDGVYVADPDWPAIAEAVYPELTLVQRVWSHDISSAEVSAYSKYYKSNATCFGAFLGSLGLRAARDRAKPAFNALSVR